MSKKKSTAPITPIQQITTTIELEQWDKLSSLLDANPGITDEENNSPLHIAAFLGKYAAAFLILERLKTTDLKKESVNAQNKFLANPFTIALGASPDIIELFLQIDPTLAKQQFTILNKNKVAMPGLTALHIAAFHGNDEVTRILLANGADYSLVNLGGETPLHVAAQNNRGKVVTQLLGAKAQLTPDDHGNTPLVGAALAGCTDSVLAFLNFNPALVNERFSLTAIMLSNGIGIPEVTPNSTLLHAAIVCNHIPLAMELMKRAELLNAPNGNGESPVFVASRMGHDFIVSGLIEAGANLIMARNDGITPLMAAVINGRGEIAKMLARHDFSLLKATTPARDDITRLALTFNPSMLPLLDQLSEEAKRWGSKTSKKKNPDLVKPATPKITEEERNRITAELLAEAEEQAAAKPKKTTGQTAEGKRQQKEWEQRQQAKAKAEAAQQAAAQKPTTAIPQPPAPKAVALPAPAEPQPVRSPQPQPAVAQKPKPQKPKTPEPKPAKPVEVKPVEVKPVERLLPKDGEKTYVSSAIFNLHDATTKKDITKLTKLAGELKGDGKNLKTYFSLKEVEGGNTALCTAFTNGDVVTAETLLSLGADAEVAGAHGLFPAHIAAKAGNKTMLEMLTNFNVRDNMGATPLHRVFNPNINPELQIELVEFLISKGARTDLPDQGGFTPLYFITRARDFFALNGDRMSDRFDALLQSIIKPQPAVAAQGASQLQQPLQQTL